MDAFDIALLMANQDASKPVKMRYGTVVAMDDGDQISVIPDGQVEAVPAIRCCHPAANDRVVMLVDNAEWLAVGTVGRDTTDDEILNLRARIAELEYDTGWVNIYYVSTSNSKIDIKARRTGRLVTVIGTCTNYYDVGNSTYHDVTTLGEKFRPSCTIPFTFNFMGGDPVGQSAYIEPNGLIRMYAVYSGKTYWNFSVSYSV